MDNQSNRINLPGSGVRIVVAALLAGFVLTVGTPAARAQTYNVIYNFTGHSDGAIPYAGVTLDRAGNLYGTTSNGGDSCGAVFELAHGRGGWMFTPIHVFSSTGGDGCKPQARVVFGAGSALYGTTTNGGTQGYGSVFQLLPPVHVCTTPSCPWIETIVHGFSGPYGEAYPGGGDLIFDPQGNIWGTTEEGWGYLCDDSPCGSIYELTPSQGGWIETPHNVFSGLGFAPFAGVVRDNVGNLYGTFTALAGGVYEVHDGVLDQLYAFSGSVETIGGVILDSAGNLYGTTASGGSGGGGTVFKLNPSNSNLTTLYNFVGPNQDQVGPTANLLMDTQGNLYGTTFVDGAHQQGSVFKLSPSGDNWTLTTLYDFTGGADGGRPFGQLTMDANGNLYGTTTLGGSNGDGVVFEITP